MPVIASNNPLFTTPSVSLTPEQDALRWRALMERIAALERATGVAVKYNATAAPGGSEIVSQTIRAGKILGPGSPMTSTVSDDFQNLIRVVYDSNGIQRVQEGNLAAYTDPSGVVSAAGFNLRLLDAQGNILLDGAGPPQVMKSLGSASGSGNITSGAFTAVPGAGFSFTVNRRVSVLALFLGNGQSASEGAGKWGNLRASLVGSTQSGAINFGNVATSTGMGWHFVSGLAAGTYTWRLEFSTNDGVTQFSLAVGVIQGFLSGG
jgi:hypothetical protein